MDAQRTLALDFRASVASRRAMECLRLDRSERNANGLWLPFTARGLAVGQQVVAFANIWVAASVFGQQIWVYPVCRHLIWGGGFAVLPAP